jgi:uncharacterized protein
MTGIKNLGQLLAGMDPILGATAWVFVTLPDAAYGDRAELAPLGCFHENEGLTLIIPRSRADDAGCAYDGVYRAITLRVHSSLSAVGLTAAVAAALADHGISANVVAAFHHDHIFVPADRAAEALDALHALQQSHC